MIVLIELDFFLNLFQVTEIMGGLFQRTELSEVLTEINKLDPTFEKESFLRYCEKEIIPNVLESMCRQDLEVSKT